MANKYNWAACNGKVSDDFSASGAAGDGSEDDSDDSDNDERGRNLWDDHEGDHERGSGGVGDGREGSG